MSNQPARERHAFSAVFTEVTVDPATEVDPLRY
jgi:hypothetical protein